MTNLVGSRISHFRVVDLIGKGGMGEVYVGYDEKLERKVALKIIRSDRRPDAEARSRFLREARVLSQLAHPNICQIFDYIESGGIDFLVLELIEGQSLTQAMKRGLDYRQKFHIADQLVGVLIAAHEKGIIHRDLKPDNIMLMDGEQVKVLDFGLSRLQRDAITATISPSRVEEQPQGKSPVLDNEGTLSLPDNFAGASSSSPAAGSGALTAMGTIMGTLSYMSPEQARGEVASTSSDLYSFGLILQELFTGKHPYECGLDAPALLRRAMVGETLPADGIDADLAALIGRLKSLSPAARPSAVDTAERLAWIRRKPVRRRKKILIAAAMAVLAFFGVAMTFQTIRATSAEKSAIQDAETSKQVSEFLVGLFRVSDPGEAKGNTVTARELLDRGSGKIEKELKDQPEIQARLMDTMGLVYYRLGLYLRAQPLLETALATRRKMHGPDHPDVATSLLNLSSLYRQQGKYAEAESFSQQSLKIREKVLGPDHPDVSGSLINLANVYFDHGKYTEAESLYQRSLKIREKALGPDHPGVAATLMNLAVLNEEQGKYTEAESLYKRSLKIREKAFGTDHPDVADLLDNLASLYLEQSKHGEAEPLYKRSLKIREKVLGSDHPDVAAGLDNLASLYTMQTRYAEAEPLFQRSLGIREKVLGPDHPDVSNSLNNLANLYADLGRYAEAEPLYQRSLRIREKSLGPNHKRVASSLLNLALLYRDQGKYAKAEPLLRRGLEIQEKSLGPDHPNVAQGLFDLAKLYTQQAKYGEAAPLFQRSLSIREKAFGPNHPDVALSYYGLAGLNARRGKRAEALGFLQRALPGGRDEPWMRSIGKDSDFVSLHKDPEFERIVAEVNKQQENRKTGP